MSNNSDEHSLVTALVLLLFAAFLMRGKLTTRAKLLVQLMLIPALLAALITDVTNRDMETFWVITVIGTTAACIARLIYLRIRLRQLEEE